MTGQVGEWSADRPGVRTVLGVAALAGGMAASWLASGNAGVLAAMAVVLAAGNGYGKAYSP
jgi:O-acetylhomoserine/O-acetylserine sulfhydrylase-like pyridoxal-dependent enzyme